MEFMDSLKELDAFARALARSSTRCPQTQDDLHQEALIVILGVTLRYSERPAHEVLKLARTAVRNRLTDLARRRHTYARHSRAASSYGELADGNPEHEVEAAEILEFVRRRLSPGPAEAMALTLRGLAPRDVSAVTGWSRTTTFRHLRRMFDEIEAEQGR